MRDPYDVLGVQKTDTGSAIRTAYRKLAKKHHPDLNPDKPETAERFKEISAAYGILSDAEKRARYDRGEIDAEGNEVPPQRPFYRDYGAQFQRGVKPREVLLYWGGDERGNDFAEPTHDFAWSVPIATQCLHAAGSALAFKIRKEPRVALATVGDGGTSKGDFYAAINAGGAFNLPLVIVIVNNQYAISIPRAQQTAAKTLAQKGVAAGIDSIQVDGNDLIAMRVALDHAIKRARHGHGASLIEAVTYRLSDHTTADDARRYRSEDEVKAAWEKEPIKRLRGYLQGMNAWTDDEEKEWLAECGKRVDEEIDAYLAVKPQPVSAMFDYTYAELPLDLERQRADALTAAKG